MPSQNVPINNPPPAVTVQPTTPTVTAIMPPASIKNVISAAEAPFTGPDTSAYPEEVIGSSGNWKKKSEWWRQAKKLSLEIDSVGKDIADLRKTFTQKYINIGDQHLDFYQSFGFEQGKIEELFASIDKYLEKQRRRKIEEFTEKSQRGELKRRDFQGSIDLVGEKITSYKVQLEQLKLDLQSIEELDKSLLERLTKVDEHVSQVSQDIAKVNEINNTMVHVIDHNKARELYFKLKNEIIAKLETIKKYLSETLMQDFEKVTATIGSQIEKTKTTIKQLEEKGLIIKDRARKIKDIKQQRIQEQEMKKQLDPSNQEPVAKRKVVQQESWYSPLTNFISGIYDFIAGLFSPLTNLIYGPPPKKALPAREASPATKPPAIATVPVAPIAPAAGAIYPARS